MIKLSIENSELRRLNESLKRHEREINAEASEGLKKAGLKILAKAKENLKKNGSIATGLLRDSGIVKVAEDKTVDVLFNANYAIFVENGRKGGKPQPYKPILEWIKKKGIVDTYSKSGKQNKKGVDYNARLVGMAIAIAKSIGKKGTKAKPFLYPAFRESENEVIDILKKAIQKVIK